MIVKYYGKELYHSGIKGQKWGKRNYQYEDGSYTPEGKKRYGIGDGESYSGVNKGSGQKNSTNINNVKGIKNNTKLYKVGDDRYVTKRRMAGARAAGIGISLTAAGIGASVGGNIGQAIGSNFSDSGSKFAAQFTGMAVGAIAGLAASNKGSKYVQRKILSSGNISVEGGK